MKHPIVKGALSVEGRGRKLGSQNSDTPRRQALIADVAASNLSNVEAAIVVHPEFYQNLAIQEDGEQRREQLAHLRKMISEVRKG